MWKWRTDWTKISNKKTTFSMWRKTRGRTLPIFVRSTKPSSKVNLRLRWRRIFLLCRKFKRLQTTTFRFTCIRMGTFWNVWMASWRQNNWRKFRLMRAYLPLSTSIAMWIKSLKLLSSKKGIGCASSTPRESFKRLRAKVRYHAMPAYQHYLHLMQKEMDSVRKTKIKEKKDSIRKSVWR